MLLLCEDITSIHCLGTRKKGPHYTQDLLAPWSQASQFLEGRKCISVSHNPLGIWYFIIACQTHHSGSYVTLLMVSSQSLRSFLSPASIHLSKMHRNGEDGAMDLFPAGFPSFLLKCCSSILIWCLCWELGQMVFCSVTPASFGIRMRDKGCSVLTPESRNQPRYKKIPYRARLLFWL